MKLDRINTALYLEDVFGSPGKYTQSGLLYWYIDAGDLPRSLAIMMLPNCYMKLALEGHLSSQFYPDTSKIDLISIGFFGSLIGTTSSSKLVNKIAAAWKKDEA